VKGGKADGTLSQPRDHLGRFRLRERPCPENAPSLFISDQESTTSVQAEDMRYSFYGSEEFGEQFAQVQREKALKRKAVKSRAT
jgi:hypothetical protein